MAQNGGCCAAIHNERCPRVAKRVGDSVLFATATPQSSNCWPVLCCACDARACVVCIPALPCIRQVGHHANVSIVLVAHKSGVCNSPLLMRPSVVPGFAIRDDSSQAESVGPTCGCCGFRHRPTSLHAATRLAWCAACAGQTCVPDCCKHL